MGLTERGGVNQKTKDFACQKLKKKLVQLGGKENWEKKKAREGKVKKVASRVKNDG